jgi:hypothetical protein
MTVHRINIKNKEGLKKRKTITLGGEGEMEEKRIFARIKTTLEAQYHTEEEEEWKDCQVIDVSQIGMGIKFLTREKNIVGSIIHLKIFIPKELRPVNVKGILKWIKPRKNDFIGGIEVTLLTRAES